MSDSQLGITNTIPCAWERQRFIRGWNGCMVRREKNDTRTSIWQYGLF